MLEGRSNTHDTALADTVNPRINPLGAYLLFMLFGWGLIRGGLINNLKF